MVAIIDKKTEKIIYKNTALGDKKLKGNEIYPYFNPKVMEIVEFDGDILPEHYKVVKGKIVELTFKEKVKEGLVEFGEDLFSHVEFDGKNKDLPSMQLVKVGLKYNLIKTLDHCNLAFNMLDEEFENQIAREYRPGYETKILKDYINWSNEGKPKNDKREKKYLEMQAFIDKLKEEYKPVRAKLKKIIGPLKKLPSNKKK